MSHVMGDQMSRFADQENSHDYRSRATPNGALNNADVGYSMLADFELRNDGNTET